MRVQAALVLWGVLVAAESHAFTLMEPGIRGWQTTTLTFRWNPSGCGIDTDLFERALRDALAAWNSAPSSALTLEYGGQTSTTLAALRNKTATDTPVLVCNSAFVTERPRDDKTTGLGFAQFRNSAGPNINFGYVELNSQSTSTGRISSLPEESLALLLTHEVGHVLGLGHSIDASSVMSYDRKYYGRPLLSGDDMDALSFLYPRDELDGSPALGCGTISTDAGRGGGGVALANLALWLLLPWLGLRLRRASQLWSAPS